MIQTKSENGIVFYIANFAIYNKIMPKDFEYKTLVKYVDSIVFSIKEDYKDIYNQLNKKNPENIKSSSISSVNPKDIPFFQVEQDFALVVEDSLVKLPILSKEYEDCVFVLYTNCFLIHDKECERQNQ